MKLDVNKLLFNGAGVLIGLFAVGYAVNDLMSTETTKACEQRYAVSTLFPVTNAQGALLSPIELQAMAGSREQGILKRARLVEVGGAPAPAVLEIHFARGETKSDQRTQPRADAAATGTSGIAMQWMPGDVSGAASACLTYSAYLPADFDFGDGGMLPGLFGGTRFDGHERGEQKPGFAARVTWREKGVGDANVQVPKNADKHGTSIARDRYQFVRGKWMTIEQEVVLNTPKQANGVYRLWVDGAMKVERTNLTWRDDDKTTIDGVVGSVGFGTFDRPAGAPRESHVRISPFELRWK